MLTAWVRRWRTIRVLDGTYSLPSRLIGERVTVRLYTDHLEVYYCERLMERLPRLHHNGQAHIGYRHVIRTLVRKPDGIESESRPVESQTPAREPFEDYLEGRMTQFRAGARRRMTTTRGR